jgi:hypothetical protein
VVFFLVECVIAQFTILNDGKDRLLSLLLLATTLPIAILDSKSLQKVGVHVSAFWWLFLPPLYLLIRAIRLRRGYSILVVWIGC